MNVVLLLKLKIRLFGRKKNPPNFEDSHYCVCRFSFCQCGVAGEGCLVCGSFCSGFGLFG